MRSIQSHTRRSLLGGLAATALGRTACAACDVHTVAETKLRNVVGFLTIEVSIGGVPASLLLDTGAEAGLVTPEAALRLRLPLDPSRQTLVQGTGGAGAVIPHVMLGGLAIGGLELPPRSVPVGPLPAIPRTLPPVAGLLGADVLSGFNVEIDTRHGHLALHRVSGECDVPVPWAHDVVPLRRVGDRLIASARLDDHPLDALLDTGALSIALDTGAALKLGVTADTLASDPGGISGGVDMREVPFHWHRFASLAIGRIVIRHPVLTVTQVREATPMLLGASWFAGRRVWLSYATARMFVAH
ncbi:MAG: aspartyl protease family protein [Alphaproteobacteria bacterium]|nr:aspartyl protease family protein [Alphaproteobacteria bacterium]